MTIKEKNGRNSLFSLKSPHDFYCLQISDTAAGTQSQQLPFGFWEGSDRSNYKQSVFLILGTTKLKESTTEGRGYKYIVSFKCFHHFLQKIDNSDMLGTAILAFPAFDAFRSFAKGFRVIVIIYLL